jgi:hypothetical protein
VPAPADQTRPPASPNGAGTSRPSADPPTAADGERSATGTAAEPPGTVDGAGKAATSGGKAAKTGKARMSGGNAAKTGKAARSGGAAATSGGKAAKTGKAATSGGKAATSGGKGARAGTATGAKGRMAAVPAGPGPGLVVGPVPALARAAGAVALAAAALLLVGPALPLARSGGHDLGGAGNLFGFVPALPLAAVATAAGALAAAGRLPRLALAALLPAGTLGAGLLLRTLALTDTGARSTLDLPLGIGTSARYEVGAGLVVPAAGYALLVVAAVLAAVAWPRALMEDDGSLDPRRPRLAAWGLAAGVLAALVLGMAPYASSIAPGTPSLPERSGPDLLGALVLALGAMVWAVISATLRPRLAVVGAYAGLAAVLLSEGLADWLLVARSPAIGASAGGVGTLLAGLAVAGLAAAAVDRRGRRRPTI